MKKISVVICTYNRPKLVIKALDSLWTQTSAKDRYEIVVVDNNSELETHDLISDKCKTIGIACLVTEEKQGLSYARNRGISQAQYDLIGFIDDDAVVDSNWVERALSNFETVLPEPSVMGGKVIPWFEKQPPRWHYPELELFSWGNDSKFLKGRKARNGFAGGNIIFRKDVLKRFGGFEGNLGMVGNSIGLGEETELCMRIYEEEPYFYYDPHLLIKHFIPAKKMTIRYQIERAYKGGRTNYQIRDDRNLMIVMSREVIKLIIASIASIVGLVFYIFPSKWQKRMAARSIIEASVAVGWLRQSMRLN